MKRTTINIPDELDAWIRHEAKRREVTLSAIVRKALLEYRSNCQRRLLAAVSGASGEDDISERIEDILTDEWGKADAGYRSLDL